MNLNQQETAGKSASVLALGAITFRDRPFDQIATAASASGFDGVGLTVGQCISALERGIALDTLRSRLDAAGLTVAELELVRLCEGGPVAHINSTVEHLCELLQPDRVHTAAFTGTQSQVEDEFGALCLRLNPIPVAVEFMPYNNVPNLAAAVQLLDAVNAPNGRIVLDVLHFFRSGGQLEDLDAFDIDGRVAVAQLSDVAGRAHDRGLAHEARHLRTYPGRGTLPIAEFLRAVGRNSSSLPPISVEPISDALEALPLSIVAEETAFSTAKILEQSGYPLPRG